MLESLIAEKNTGGKKTLRKDIDYQHFLAIDNFHKNSYFWSYVLNFNGKYVMLYTWQGMRYCVTDLGYLPTPSLPLSSCVADRPCRQIRVQTWLN